MPKSPLRTSPTVLASRRINKREASVLAAAAKQVMKVEYDFAIDGGAQGSIDFAASLPDSSVVTNIYSDELTALTSGGAATVQLKAGATDLTDAIAFDTGFSGVQSQALASSATAIKVDSEDTLALEIATADLTAGKVILAIEFYTSDLS